MSWTGCKSSIFFILAVVWSLQCTFTVCAALLLDPVLEDNGLNVINEDQISDFLFGNAEHFEGDIIITQKQYDEYYRDQDSNDQSEQPDHLRVTRATRRSKRHLWPNGIVPYTFNESVPSGKEAVIRTAMDIIANKTCLKFVPHTDEPDYVIYGYRSGCWSYVGRIGGSQVVNVGRGCGLRAALHEICHALGMWHEQSRPDRDNYVRILRENIKPKYLFAFGKRINFSVDSLGTPYDYASIMHYGAGAFKKARGLKTIEIVNDEWYEEQGFPVLGGSRTLSLLDTVQLNRLYNCPGSGVQGRLRVHIGQTENLRTYASTKVLVQVRAVNDNKTGEIKSTRSLVGAGNRLWDEWLEFGEGAWQYIEINIIRDTGGALTRKQSFSVNPGNHSYRHNGTRSGYRQVNFSIELDEYECPCLNGGSCVHYPICTCPENFDGPLCQYSAGQLSLYLSYGTNLPNRDSRAYNVSDAFLKITAFDRQGRSRSLRSKTIRDNLNPIWNESIDFGRRAWSQFTVEVWDDDSDGPYRGNRLSAVHEYNLTSFTPMVEERLDCYQGYVSFNYTFYQ